MQNIDTLELISDEAYQEALDEWIGVLSRLWTACGKIPDTDRLVLYQEELAIVPLGLLQKAVSRAIREHAYNNVPTVGELWAAVRKELGDPHDIEQAISDWKYVTSRQCIVRFPAVLQPVASSVAAETEIPS